MTTKMQSFMTTTHPDLLLDHVMNLANVAIRAISWDKTFRKKYQ